MANFTKKAIADSFIKLLTERPLSQITVKDIVADCGINRNTFYYYYADVPSLTESVFSEEVEEIIHTYPSAGQYKDCLEAIVNSALSKKRAIMHIYHSSKRDMYEKGLWKVCDHAAKVHLASVLNGQTIDEKDLLIIEKCASSFFFGVICNWLRGEMKGDIQAAFTRIIELNDGMIEEMIARCKE